MEQFDVKERNYSISFDSEKIDHENNNVQVSKPDDPVSPTIGPQYICY